jgi:hypothetical protein
VAIETNMTMAFLAQSRIHTTVLADRFLPTFQFQLALALLHSFQSQWVFKNNLAVNLRTRSERYDIIVKIVKPIERAQTMIYCWEAINLGCIFYYALQQLSYGKIMIEFFSPTPLPIRHLSLFREIVFSIGNRGQDQSLHGSSLTEKNCVKRESRRKKG